MTRKQLISKLKYLHHRIDLKFQSVIGLAIEELQLPEIIRCKDCEFQYTEKCHCSYDNSTEWDDDGYLEYDYSIEYLMGDDDFCSYGEKRKEIK